MKQIILNDSDVTTKKVDTEYIKWNCPNCNHKNITNEWLMDSLKNEMICDKCNEFVKYSWNRVPYKTVSK